AVDTDETQIPDINFLLADAYSGVSNLPKAIASLEKALTKDKNNVEAYARLADLYQKNNMPDKAKQVFEKCITLKPNDPALYRTLGDYNLKSKKYREALTYFEKSYLLEKNGLTAAGIASAAMALGNIQKAQDAAESAVRLNASLVEPRFILYKCYMKNKSYKEAREQLSYILDKKPGEIEYWKGLAECSVQLKDAARCADADKKIAELDKSNVESRLRLGAFWVSQREDVKALGMYKELAALTPQNADVFKNLYTLSNTMGDKASALTYLRKYCVLKPGDVSSQKYLGLLYYDSKNFDIALEAFRKAVKADPSVKGIYKQYADIVLTKGLTEEIKTVLSGASASGEADGAMYSAFAAHYQKAGLTQQAIPLYQKASELDPRNVRVLFDLAKCHERLGHVDEAILWYGQALALNSSAVEEYKTLGNLYLKKNKKSDAVAAFKRYLDAGKTDPAAARQVADLSYAQKNYDDAVRYFALVTGEESKKADYLFHYGQACYAVKNFKKAFELLSQAAILMPQNPEIVKTLFTIASQDSTLKKNAVGYLTKYIALKPGDAASQRMLADMLYAKNDLDGALRAYHKVVMLDPTAKGIYKRYYELATKRGSPGDVEAALTGAVGSGEADGPMYGQLGSIYEQKGLYDKAMALYSKAMQIDPNNVAAIGAIGRCQMKTG
ncbi:MAG TPA: tetratricopeptide repeat protein, partial [Chitinivibrionales bacterium]